MSKQQMMANSLELMGYRLNEFIKSTGHDRSQLKLSLTDIKNTLNEYYGGDYIYWKED